MKRGERNAVVVADAGPLIGLAKIGSIELLHRLFGSVLIPEAVAAELHLDTPLPGALALNLARKQGWLKIQEVSAVPRRLLETVDCGEAVWLDHLCSYGVAGSDRLWLSSFRCASTRTLTSGP